MVSELNAMRPSGSAADTEYGTDAGTLDASVRAPAPRNVPVGVQIAIAVIVVFVTFAEGVALYLKLHRGA